jgi:hypothetical protein
MTALATVSFIAGFLACILVQSIVKTVKKYFI